MTDICVETSDEYCTDFECPADQSLIDDADSTVCKESGCTSDLCCTPNGKLDVT